MEDQTQLPKITELTDIELMGAQKHWTAQFIAINDMMAQINNEVDRRLNMAANTLLPPTTPEK